MQTTNVMFDSGTVTHVCRLWFADSCPSHSLEPGQRPQLRTTTNKAICIHGVRWACMKSQQQLLPILSVMRLAEEGVDIKFSNAPAIRHMKVFDVQLVLLASQNHDPGPQSTGSTNSRQDGSNDCSNNIDKARTTTSLWRRQRLLGIQH